MKSKDELLNNIKTLVRIRENPDNLPAVKVQAIQTLQKLIAEDDPETKRNLEVLREIRDDETVNDAVHIQAVQTMHKIFVMIEGEEIDERPTESDIMAKIRKAKQK